MSKILWLLIIATIALTAGGALEIKFHSDRLPSVPGQLASFAHSKATLEKGRAFALNLKRTGEQFIIQDNQQKLEIVTKDIQDDADRLQEQLASETDPEVILPQAQLLIDSFKRAQNIAAQASPDTLAGLQDTTNKAHAAAQVALAQLEEQRQQYAAVQAEFAQVTQDLAQYVGQDDQVGSVAGTKTNDTAPASDNPPTAEPTIPLSF